MPRNVARITFLKIRKSRGQEPYTYYLLDTFTDIVVDYGLTLERAKEVLAQLRTDGQFTGTVKVWNYKVKR
jgi:hypothetical protein